MNPRSIVLGAIVIVVVAGGLWGVWVLESRSAVRENTTPTGEFSFQLTRGTDDTGDIMLLCPEDFMDEPTQAFAKWLKLDDTVPLKIPAGMMLLARLNDVSVDASLKPLQRSTIEILKRYSPRHVVLVAHTNCLYYDTIAAWNDNLSGVRQREVGDLRAAVSVLREWFPRAEVSGYLAEEDPSHRLVFHAADKVAQ